MTAAHLLGPAWTANGLDLARSPRYPLRVETHVAQMVDALVPGVITVTPHARYLTLHALCWATAQARGLDLDASTDLLRRAETVVAGIAVRHERHDGHDLRIGAAHGADIVAPHVQADDGMLAVAELSAVGKYSQARWGFGGTYLGSELQLGLLSGASNPVPGPRCDVAVAEAALGAVLDVAAHDAVAVSQLDQNLACCICKAPNSADGPWLQRLLADPHEIAGYERADHARRDTVRLLAAVIREREPGGGLEPAFKKAVAFGDLLQDASINTMDAAHVWRGVILRSYSVGAWRRIWAWLVDQLSEPMTATDFAQRLADAMPAMTVQQLIDELPPSVAGDELLPAELDVRTTTRLDPVEDLQVLAIGGQRCNELDGLALRSFTGGEDQVLAPAWVAGRLERFAPTSLRDFAYELAQDLLNRARRVALSKVQINKDGTLWYPSRVVERDGILIRRGTEGSGDVGLRIATLGEMLLSAGVLTFDNDRRWGISDKSVIDV